MSSLGGKKKILTCCLTMTSDPPFAASDTCFSRTAIESSKRCPDVFRNDYRNKDNLLLRQGQKAKTGRLNKYKLEGRIFNTIRQKMTTRPNLPNVSCKDLEIRLQAVYLTLLVLGGNKREI